MKCNILYLSKSNIELLITSLYFLTDFLKMSNSSTSTKRRRILDELAEIAAIDSEESISLESEDTPDVVLPVVQKQNQLDGGDYVYIYYLLLSIKF